MKPSSAHVSLLSEKITMAAIVWVLVHDGSGGVRMHGRWLAGVVSLYLFSKILHGCNIFSARVFGANESTPYGIYVYPNA